MFPFKVLSCLLSQLSSEVSQVLQTTALTIRHLLTLNFLAVETVLKIGKTISESLLNYVTQLFYALCYSFHDFTSFLIDILNILTVLVTCVNESVVQIANFAHILVGEAFVLLNLASDAIFSVKIAFETVLMSGLSFVTFLGRSAALIANGTIFTLCLVPKSIAGTYEFAKTALESSVTSIYSVFVKSYYGVVETIVFARHAVVAIPKDAYLGLALSCGLYFAVKYLKQSQRFRRSSLRALTVIRNARQTLHLETWRIGGWSLGIRNVREQPSSEDESSESEYEDSNEPQTAENEMFRLKRQLAEERESRLCVVCYDRVKCITLWPCCHLCLCQECFDAVMAQGANCPICRKRIENSLHVFP